MQTLNFSIQIGLIILLTLLVAIVGSVKQGRYISVVFGVFGLVLTTFVIPSIIPMFVYHKYVPTLLHFVLTFGGYIALWKMWSFVIRALIKRSGVVQ